jgi:hypothetical protein
MFLQVDEPRRRAIVVECKESRLAVTKISRLRRLLRIRLLPLSPGHYQNRVYLHKSANRI